MTLVEDRDRWAALVGAAQRGDAHAWPALIDRFEDLAVASAVGLCGDLDEAPDIAQEAFVLAFRHIAGLQDPAAFPAWLLRLVRTATNRRTRRRRPATVPLDALARDDGPGALVGPGRRTRGGRARRRRGGRGAGRGRAPARGRAMRGRAAPPGRDALRGGRRLPRHHRRVPPRSGHGPPAPD